MDDVSVNDYVELDVLNMEIGRLLFGDNVNWTHLIGKATIIGFGSK